MAGGPWGVCDRCGFKVRHRLLRKEWTGLMVCPDDWDEKPAELRPPPVKPEGLPIRNPRPEPTPVFREEGELGGDDL
jgi:hypothetical protein